LLPHANIASTAVTPGSYTNANITVAADGSITAASNGTPGTGCITTGTSILKGDGSGGCANATAGTDYAGATNGTSGQALVSNGSGGFGTAVTISAGGAASSIVKTDGSAAINMTGSLIFTGFWRIATGGGSGNPPTISPESTAAAGSLVLIPGTVSTGSNFHAKNSPDASNYGELSMGVSGSTASIQTLKTGTGTDVTTLKIGSGATSSSSMAINLIYAGTTAHTFTNTMATLASITDSAVSTAGVARFSSGGVLSSADDRDVHIIPFGAAPGGTAGSGVSYASGQWTPTARAGSNNIGAALQAIPSTGAVLQWRMQLPQDWDTGASGQPYIRIEYASGSNTSGTVIWTVSSACTKADGSVSDDPAFNAESAFASQTMAAASRAWSQTGHFTAITSGNNCVPGGGLIIKAAVSGTAAAAINAYQAVVTIPTLPNAGQAE
jgi:hypothetical protein